MNRVTAIVLVIFAGCSAPRIDAPYTLVVIDVQPEFYPAVDEKLVQSVQDQIERAKKDRCPVLIVEYEHRHYSQTVQQVTELLSGYDRWAVAYKRQDDGSREVLRACRDNGFPVKRLRVCGVTSDSCVESTVFGMLEKHSRLSVEVIMDACRTDTDGWTWDKWPKHRRIKLTGQ